MSSNSSSQNDDTDPRITFGLSCPSGGDFYVCQGSSTPFIGCCSVDPCGGSSDGICPKGLLYPASFSAASGVDFVEQGCAALVGAGDLGSRDRVSPRGESGIESLSESGRRRRRSKTAETAEASWFTCSNAVPPFLGCCTNNPCNNGCLPGNLVPAVLSDDPKNASQFLIQTAEYKVTPTMSSTVLPTMKSSATPTTTTPTTTTPTTTSTTSTTSQTGAQTKSQVGLIVGLVILGVAILLAVVGAYLWVKRREERRIQAGREATRTGTDVSSISGRGGASRSLFRDPSYSEKILPPVPYFSPLEGGGLFSSGRSAHTSKSPSSERRQFSPSSYVSGGGIVPGSPGLPRVAELEGSIVCALHPKLTDAFRGFDGREDR